MVPHGEPLKDKEVPLFSQLINLDGIVVVGLVPGVLHAGTQYTKIGWRHPMIVHLQKEPHDAADHMRVDAQYEGEEKDLGEGFRLNFQVRLVDVRVHLAYAKNFQQFAKGGEGLIPLRVLSEIVKWEC